MVSSATLSKGPEQSDGPASAETCRLLWSDKPDASRILHLA